MQVTKDDIRKAIETSGLSGKAVCIHSSLRSFGTVEGGADTIITAFLEEGCTLLAPSFTYDFQISPLEVIAHNGRVGGLVFAELDSEPYNSTLNDMAADMGAIVRAILNAEGRIRGIHPTNSFVALGPDAKELVSCQTYEDVYAPFQKMMDMRGYIVLIGVDLTKMTAIHYAEQLSGRNLFIRWALDHAGVPVRIREGSCSEGFNNLAITIADIEKQITVGKSLWRIFPFYETVHACAEAIRQNSGITHCIDEKCTLCNDMQNGGPRH